MRVPLSAMTVWSLTARRWLARAWALDWPLTLTGSLMAVVLIGALIGLMVDPRVITGAPAWLKPAKFAVSIAIYCFTLLWLMQQLPQPGRLTRLVGATTALLLTVEMVAIGLQALRGQPSHYNSSTALDAAIFQTMGLSIVVVWLTGVVMAVLLVRQPLTDPVLAWSLRLAVPIALLGMVLAFLMTAPTPAQLAAAQVGGAMPTVGAHTVGQPDGGPGLPIVNWSTVAGDLRIPHFVGLHAMQVVPALGWWLQRRRLAVGQRTRLVIIGGLTYLGLVLLLTWQALRGQSIIAPDAQTMGALLALVVSAGLAVVGVLTRAGYRLVAVRDAAGQDRG